MSPAPTARTPTASAATPPAPARRHFQLSRWFGLVAALAIAAIAAASVTLLGWFVTQRMLWQEGALTREFVQSLVMVERPLQAFFRQPRMPLPADVEEPFEHIARLPDMLRANVYDRNRRVIWSSDKLLIGRQFGPNDELDLALTGAVVVEKKTEEERRHGKAEYVALQQIDPLFIEIYVPVLDVDTGQVLGAVEFYKNPRSLTRILAQLRLYIALGAVGFGAMLFAALFGLVRRADRTLQDQHKQLVQAESFAVLGEMSSVVAHGIRNPLAAIRSSAELMLDSPDADAADGARDIVSESDRLGAWLRELLTYTRAPESEAQPVALGALTRSLLQEYAREFDRRHIGASCTVDDQLPAVRGDALGLGQVLRSILANALEALPNGGRVQVSAELDPATRMVSLRVEDNGPGMTREQRERVGKPLYTTKPQGMGVGLALARRVVERAGGQLTIDSESGRGTTVTLLLRAA
jgi:two-component system, NtrC family, sensor histidine kinase HydH